MSPGAWTALIIFILLLLLLIAGLAYYVVVYQPAWFEDLIQPDPIMGDFVLQSNIHGSYLTVDNAGSAIMTSDLRQATVLNFTNNQFVIVDNATSFINQILGTNINKCQLSGTTYPRVVATSSGGYNTTWVPSGAKFRPTNCQNAYLWTNGSAVELHPLGLANGSYTWTPQPPP